MVREAQSHADEDKARREEIEARNQADSLIYQTEKTIQDNKDKLPEADVSAATLAVEAARKAVQEGGGKETIDAAVAELTRASHRLAEVLYKSTAGGAGASGEPAAEAGPGASDVVDAEVVSDEKK